MPNSKATLGRKQLGGGRTEEGKEAGGVTAGGQLQLSANESLVALAVGVPSQSRRSSQKSLLSPSCSCFLLPVSLFLSLFMSLCLCHCLMPFARFAWHLFIFMLCVFYRNFCFLPSFCLCVIVDNLLKFLCPALAQGYLLAWVHLIRKV